MKRSQLQQIIREEVRNVIKEDQNWSAMNTKVANILKKMGLTPVSVDCAPASMNHGPSCIVKFKDLYYDGGDHYDIMNDYNETRYDFSRDQMTPEFGDVEDLGGGRLKFYFDTNEMNESSASTWSKQQLDKELKMLQQGGQEMAQEMGGSIDDAMAFDIASGWISDNPGVEQAIKKHYGASDAQGFVANYVA
jgi:hypothetical protein